MIRIYPNPIKVIIKGSFNILAKSDWTILIQIQISNYEDRLIFNQTENDDFSVSKTYKPFLTNDALIEQKPMGQ